MAAGREPVCSDEEIADIRQKTLGERSVKGSDRLTLSSLEASCNPIRVEQERLPNGP